MRYLRGLLFILGILFLFPSFFTNIQAEDNQDSLLKIAIIPHRSRIGNERAYQHVVSALRKATGMSVRWINGKTYDDVIKSLRNKKADIGYVGPFAYVSAQDDFGVRLIVRTLNKRKQEFYYSMIITRKDSGIKTLQQLKGKHFSFTDPKSTSGFLFPMVGLKKAGIQLKDFARISYVKRHPNSLLAVFHKQVDAGAVASTAMDKGKVDLDQIRILWKSDPIYRGPWVARTDIPDDLFNTIKTTLLALTKRENADEIFEHVSTKGYVIGKDSDYDNVREAAKVKRELGKNK